MKKIHGNVAIGQMGGPTSVINASLVGILKGLNNHDFSGKIYMPEGGVKGFLNGKFNVLVSIPNETDLDPLSKTPGSDAISSRDKADESKCEIIHKRCEMLDIRHLFLIGGNDTAENARIIGDFAKTKGYGLSVVHVPKTIDCDLRGNDHTPGFPSAATAAANFVARMNYENRSMGGIDIFVLMGRDSSFLALSTALARKNPIDAPHLIYPSEILFDAERFISEIKIQLSINRSYGRNGVFVVVSEGIKVSCDKKERLFFEELVRDFQLPVERDAHGNVKLDDLVLATGLKKLVLTNLGEKSLRVSANAPNYLIRCAQCTELDRTEAINVGLKAVESVATEALQTGTIRIIRISNEPYLVQYAAESDLTLVARDSRQIPRDFIAESGNNVSQEFIKWSSPLISEVFSGFELKRDILQL